MINEKDLNALELSSGLTEEMRQDIFKLYDSFEDGQKSMALMQVFLYGFMIGKREERAKRRK
nr:hypothetical protein [uncultured Cellulosilyticum sp.]